MKIAIFTDSYRPQINGLVTSVELFTKELQKRGHEVLIFAPDIPNYKDKEKFVRRFRSVKFINYGEYRIGLPFSLLNGSSPKIDIVHIQSPFSMGLAGLGFAKYHKIPCVSTFHTMYNEYPHYFIKVKMLLESKKFRKFFDKLSWRYLKWFCNRCDMIIAPSSETKSALQKNGVKKEVSVIPTGTHFYRVKGSKNHLRKKHKLLPKEKILLHVGRVTQEKNIDFIIRSLRDMLASKKARLIVTSDGPYRKTLEALIGEMGLKKSVKFTGYLSHDALMEYYKLADVFVMASRTETQGIVLLEAAQNGVPCVVLNAPVIADFVRENSIGSVSNEKEFAKHVERMLTDKALRKRILTNCKNIGKKYSIEHCTDLLLNVYKRAALRHSQ